MTARGAILIVDDNALNAKLLRLVLSAEGYEITAVEDATRALAELEERPFDLILMDIQLPGMDGLELTKLLRREPRHGATVIVALSAYAMAADVERALAAGCDGYITKPIDVNELPTRLAAFLERARAGGRES